MTRKVLIEGYWRRVLFISKIMLYFAFVAGLLALASIPFVYWYNVYREIQINAEHISDIQVNFLEVLIPLIAEVIIVLLGAFYSYYQMMIGKFPYAEAIEAKLFPDMHSYKSYMPSVKCTRIVQHRMKKDIKENISIDTIFYPHVLRIWLKSEADAMVRFFSIKEISMAFGDGSDETILLFKEARMRNNKKTGDCYYNSRVLKGIYPCMHTADMFCIPVNLAIDTSEEKLMQIFEKKEQQIFLQAKISLFNNKGHKKNRNIQLELIQNSKEPDPYWITYKEI